MQTQIGDLLLIHHQEKPVGFARVEDISADHKPGWWQIRLLLLQVPFKSVTWILREEYIDGGSFTMGGEPMHLELLPRAGDMPPPPAPVGEEESRDKKSEPPDKNGQSKVVDFSRHRRRPKT